MRLHFIPASTAVSRLAIALPLVGLSALCLAAPATAEPGLQGSYVGVTVHANQLDSNSLNQLLDAGSPTAWLVDEAIAQQQHRNSSGTIVNPSNPAAEVPGRQMQGRIDLTGSPLSVRGSLYLGEHNRAVMPTVSYDLPVGDEANVYAGAGYVFVERPGTTTPLGNRNGMMLTAGAEAAVTDEVIIYGNMGFRPDARRSQGEEPMRVQVGVGRRF